MSTQPVTMYTPVTVDGRQWHLYDVEWTAEDGRRYSAYVYAVSDLHAQCVLDDLRATARIAGRVEQVIGP